MNILSSLQSTFKIATAITAVIATASLTNCGSGSASDDSTYTIRPKTLEGVTLTMPGDAASFEFIINLGSKTARNNGNTEFGGFIYNRISFSSLLNTIDNQTLTQHWPASIGSATYRYTAINDTSGEIILSAANVNHIDAEFPIPDNLHHYFDPVVTTNGTSSIRLIVSFEDNAGSVAEATVRMEDPDQPFLLDGSSTTSIFTGSFAAEGAPLAPNYNPVFDIENRVSKIALASLSGTNIIFTDSVDDSDNFTLQPSATATGVNFIDEIGQVAYLDDMGDIKIGAADYTYDRTAGTDSANLVLTGGTPDDGTIVLTFISGSSAVQEASGVYTTSSGKSGTFTVPTPIAATT